MDYELLFEKQQGRCAICEEVWIPTTARGKPRRRMHRDHNHTTLQPRGLLCQDCNRHLKDKFNTEWYLKAYNYLKEYDG
jgi:hypothetical protein